MKHKHLEELTYRTEMVKQDVRDEFSNLTAFQLNWKPTPEVWSIGQCLDHIMLADRSYFPKLDAIIQGKYKRPFWSFLPGKSKVWGKLLLSLLKPESTQKITTPALLEPTKSKLGESIVDKFLEHEEKVVKYLQELDELNYEKFYLKSPFSKYITYSLRDLTEITLLHQERHFKQAKRILSMDKFPKGDKLSRS